MSGSVPGADWDDSAEPLARPYAVRVDRIASHRPVDLLTLVHTTVAGKEALRRQQVHGPESRDIVTLCGRIRSVAEIEANLKFPLAVVQILIEDLGRNGLVSVRPPADAERPSVDVLEKVLHGLVRL